MAVLVEQHVFRLEISVNDAVVVQTADGVNNFRGVNLGSLFGKPLLLAQVSKHFSSVEEVDDEVKFGLGLEGEVQSDDVGVLDLLEDVTLGCQIKRSASNGTTYLGFSPTSFS